jgi:hypothetical protein
MRHQSPWGRLTAGAASTDSTAKLPEQSIETRAETARARGNIWCWRGELNPSGPLITRNLLILRHRENAQNAHRTPFGHAWGTRKKDPSSSFALVLTHASFRPPREQLVASQSCSYGNDRPQWAPDVSQQRSGECRPQRSKSWCRTSEQWEHGSPLAFLAGSSTEPSGPHPAT